MPCGSGDGHVRRLANIPCIVNKCSRRSVEGHAICGHHLAYEMILLVVGGFAAIGAFIAFMYWAFPPNRFGQ